MTTDRIDIICDDPHHSRGKIAKVGSFTFDSSISAWLGPFYTRHGRLVPAPPHGYRADDAELPTPFRPNVIGRRGPVSERYPCVFLSTKVGVQRRNVGVVVEHRCCERASHLSASSG